MRLKLNFYMQAHLGLSVTTVNKLKNFSVQTPVLWTTIMTPIKPQISKLTNFFERLIK
jgi:hypothetical protein